MTQQVCPWWVGYLLASPVRRLMQNPEELLRPHVWSGMTVLEPGPGMGFFTIPLAQMIGESGRVVAVDIQPQMLKSLRRRAAKAGVAPRLDARLAHPGSLGIADLEGTIDLVLACAVVHEMPSPQSFFREAAAAMKADGRILFIEPAGHVKNELFAKELDAAHRGGLFLKEQLSIPRTHSVVLAKQANGAAAH
ncbi:MAG TPA: class I SAM-dependent methyltransferase [Terracidiphilus sp.]|nr:class I SAM-dependent methyltransferase [Terracidiphilus sp.]